MRIRRLLVTGILVAVPVLAGPAQAWAAGPAPVTITFKGEIGDCKSAQEIKDIVAARGSERAKLIEDCFSAPSPVVPKTSELFWGGLAWAIVAFFLMKLGFPAIKKTLKAREDKIRGDLEAAEQAKSQADTELEQYRGQLADARTEGNRIIAEAREAADAVKRDLVKAAEAEVAEMKARAQADVARQATQAMSDLQGRVGKLSIDLAEKIVERNLDHDTQMALVESYITQVGSN